MKDILVKFTFDSYQCTIVELKLFTYIIFLIFCFFLYTKISIHVLRYSKYHDEK